MERQDDDGRESRDSLYRRYPEAYVRALRETPYPLSSEASNADSPSAEFASAGVGLKNLGRMQILPPQSFSMYDVDFFPAMKGQEALRDVQKAQTKRAREKTMEELRSILHRVQFTLMEMTTVEKELIIEDTPEPEQKPKRKRRRRKKRESTPQLATSGLGDELGKEVKEEKYEISGAQTPSKEGDTAMAEESKPDSTPKDEDVSSGSYGDYKTDSSWLSDESEEDELSDQDEVEGEPGDRHYFSTPPGMAKAQALSPSLMKKAARRRRTSNAITGYMEQCLEREDIMMQMKSWIEAAASDEPPRTLSQNDELRYSPGLLKEELPAYIGNAVETFKGTLNKLKGIADSLGIGEAEESDEEPDEVAAMKPGLPPPPKPKVAVKIFDENELTIPTNFEMATSSLIKVLDESAKSTPARRTRILLNNGLKQFRFICKVMESRDSTINQLDKEIIELGGEIAKAKKQNEELRKTKKKMQVQYDKLEHQSDDLKVKLKRQEAAVEELTKVVEDYKRKESYGLYRESSSEASSPSLNSEESYAFLDEPKPQKKPKKKSKKAAKGAGKKTKKIAGKSTTSGTSEGSEVPDKIETQGEDEVKTIPAEQTTISIKDIENTEVFQELKLSLENAERAVQIEQEKLAELEGEFDNAKSEKIKVEQEKADLEIEIENLTRQQEIEIEELKDQIDDFERENKKQRGEIECNEEMIQYQEERIAQYAEEIEKLEDRIMSLPSTPAISSTSFAKSARRDRRRSTVGLIEPPTARQMMAKFKQQYETEIQGLKDHLAKESQRHQADIRRRDQEHKKDIQNIHKESLLVLRAINRFKDCAANLLDRENIMAEAHALRKLPPLLLDDTPGETRQMLARMAILSNELLVSIELQLSKALMSKRLEMKDTTTSRGMVKKELESQTENLRKAKDVSHVQAGKLKAAREGMLEQEQDFQRYRIREGEKQEELEERYKELLSEYIALRKEGITARKAERPDREKDEEINRKEALVQKYMRREKGMQRMLEEQKKVIAHLTSAWRTRRFGQLYISIDDQMDNLKTLSQALTKNKISKTLHEMTTTLIKEAIDLPRKRLIDLVQRYTRYVHLREMEERAKRMKVEEDLGDGSMKFIYMLEKRIQKQKELWKQRREEFVNERADILMQLSRVLTRASEEASILLTQPKSLTRRVGDTKSEDSGIPDLYEAVKLMNERERLKRIQATQINARIPIGERERSPPSGTVSGYAGFNKPPMWKVKAMTAYSHVIVATPKILDIDVNQTRLAAHQIVTQVSKGSLGSKSLPKMTTLTSRVYHPVMQKSTSEPTPKTESKRTLALPPIATMYSSEEWSSDRND